MLEIIREKLRLTVIFKTVICECFGIKFPIIQAGMARVSDHLLVIAAHKTGILGTLGAGNMPPDTLDQEISKVQASIGSTSCFAVNIILINPDAESQMEVVKRRKVPVVIFGAGDPSSYIKDFHKAGIKVIGIPPSIAVAKRIAKKGIDAIIVEGSEAGGHIGRFSTITLLPGIVDALKEEGYDVPIIAAGGICDGRSLAASFILGARGGQTGTRFLCATETNIPLDIKKAYIKANDVTKVVVTGRNIGWPVQVIRNQLTSLYQEWEKDYLLGKRTKEEVESLGIGKLREAMEEGNIKTGSLMAGQSVIRVKKIQPVAEIVDEIVREAVSFLSKLDLKGVEANE